MSRNLDRRVEAVVPVDDAKLRQRLERLLELYLKDNRGAWDMQRWQLHSTTTRDGEDVRNSQLQLIKQWSQASCNRDLLR